MSSSERKAEEAAFARSMHRLKTEGLEDATEAVILLLREKNGPAQARSAAVNTVFRATGMLDVEKEGSGEFDGLTLAELERLLRAKEKEAEENQRLISERDNRTKDSAQPEGDDEAEDRDNSLGGIFD